MKENNNAPLEQKVHQDYIEWKRSQNVLLE